MVPTFRWYAFDTSTRSSGHVTDFLVQQLRAFPRHRKRRWPDAPLDRDPRPGFGPAARRPGRAPSGRLGEEMLAAGASLTTGGAAASRRAGRFRGFSAKWNSNAGRRQQIESFSKLSGEAETARDPGRTPCTRLRAARLALVGNDSGPGTWPGSSEYQRFQSSGRKIRRDGVHSDRTSRRMRGEWDDIAVEVGSPTCLRERCRIRTGGLWSASIRGTK